jgi:Avidin family
MSRLVTALLLVVAATVSVFAQSLPVPSYWTNQRQSQMKLYYMDPQGNFTGVYINNAQGFGCQGTPFALTGHAAGANVTFTVVWNNGIQNCNSTTIWRGVVTGQKLPTNWILISPHAPPQYGTDLFTQQP